MSNIIDVAGLIEPVTVAEMKQFLVIDLDYTEDDLLIGSLITSTRMRMERHLNVALISRTGLIFFSQGQNTRNIRLPFASQLLAVTTVTDNATPPVNTTYVNEYGRFTIYGNDVKVTYNISVVANPALLICLKRMVATSFKYREDLSNDQVYKLNETSLDQVEIYSKNLYL